MFQRGDVLPLIIFDDLFDADVGSVCRFDDDRADGGRLVDLVGTPALLAPTGIRSIRLTLSASNKALDQVRQLSEQIGLSGSSRSRIKTNDPASETDPAEAFLRGSA